MRGEFRVLSQIDLCNLYACDQRLPWDLDNTILVCARNTRMLVFSTGSLS